MKIAVIDGKAFTVDENYIMKPIEDGVFDVKSKKQDVRSLQQNKAIHKYFNLLADTLNEKELTIPKVLKIDTYWSATAVKEQLWRPLQLSVTNKKSTTTLKKDEISKVYDALNGALWHKLRVSVPFPSYEN